MSPSNPGMQCGSQEIGNKTNGTDHGIPLDSRDLDVQSLLDLAEVDRGEELWVPVSFIRGNKFRAVKIRVLDRVSVGNFEEINAVDPWPQSDRYPTDHEIAEGINCTLQAGGEWSATGGKSNQ